MRLNIYFDSRPQYDNYLGRRIDDEIYEDFKSKFAELFEDGAKGIAIVDEDLMKNSENKVRWRNFVQGLDFARW